MEIGAELPHRLFGTQLRKHLNPLGFTFDLPGPAGDYNAGQTTLFEEVQLCVIEPKSGSCDRQNPPSTCSRN